MLLNQSILLDYIKQECFQDTKEIILCSAFLKLNILEELESYLNNSEVVKIYVRWQELDFIRGASDLDIYEVCKRNHWELFFNNSIHAKFFLIDSESLFIGSSNYTLSGTGRGNKNIEWNYSTRIDYDEQIELKNSIALSTRVDDDIYSQIKEKIEILKPQINLDLIEERNTGEPSPSYNFNFDILPHFSPSDLFKQPLNKKDKQYLLKFNINNLQDLSNYRKFILESPITNIIRDFHSTRDKTLRWGTLKELISQDEHLYSLCENNNDTLVQELHQDNRLYNFFCWLAHFDDSLFVYTNERYLEDPRRGTCSINIKE